MVAGSNRAGIPLCTGEPRPQSGLSDAREPGFLDSSDDRSVDFIARTGRARRIDAALGNRLFDRTESMKLQMIGCSHHDTAVEFRERLSLTTDQVRETLGAFRNQFPSAELVLLSTCNRVELYASCNDDTELDAKDVAKFLADRQRLSPDEVFAQMIYRSGDDAVKHLFTVAASLNSMVVGEAQILSQVKQAYELACQNGSAGPLTHVLFQAANRTAKRVQTETSIHRRRVSVPSVAVGEIVPEVFDSLRDKRVLLCGAGEMGEETLRYLKQAGATDICVLNRSQSRAEELAREFDARVDRLGFATPACRPSRPCIGTTASPEPILSASDYQSLQAQRQGTRAVDS